MQAVAALLLLLQVLLLPLPAWRLLMLQLLPAWAGAQAAAQQGCGRNRAGRQVAGGACQGRGLPQAGPACVLAAQASPAHGHASVRAGAVKLPLRISLLPLHRVQLLGCMSARASATATCCGER